MWKNLCLVNSVIFPDSLWLQELHVIRFCSPRLVWWANSSPFSQNAALQESVVHLNFISCFKCCLRRCRLRPLLLFRHFQQSSHISSRGRDSSTCSERIISSGLLTFFSGSNDYNCNCLQIDNKDIKSWFHNQLKNDSNCSPWSNL
jgi:hypothetical protein